MIRDLGKPGGNTLGNKFAARNDQIDLAESGAQIFESDLRQPFSVHVQNDAKLWIKAFDQTGELRIVMNMHYVASLAAEV
jgi:hypothetical protein